MTDTPKKSSVKDKNRRRFLVNTTATLGAIGTVGFLTPLVLSMNPNAKARAAGAPEVIDISRLQPGEQITAVWRSKPIWVLYRTAEMIQQLNKVTTSNFLRDPNSEVTKQQPLYAQNELRSIQEKYFITIAVCTHLGCIPKYRPEVAARDLGTDWPGGYFCPCHGSKFDLAGRVFVGVPAPINLEIPPHRFLSDTLIEIGTSDPVV